MNLSDKIFILALIFGVAWLVMIALSTQISIDPALISGVEKVTLMLIGALVGAFAKEGDSKNGKTKQKRRN